MADAGSDRDDRRHANPVERLGHGRIHLVRVSHVADDVCALGEIPHDHLDAGGPLALHDGGADAGGPADHDGSVGQRRCSTGAARA